MMQHDQTVAVRTGQDLNLSRLLPYMRARIDGIDDIPDVRQFAGGLSNITYLLKFENRSFVLRRPPPGTKAKSSHQMWREYKIMNALRPSFPYVPETFFHVADEAVLGAEFYVMALVPGVTVMGPTLPGDWNVTRDGARKLCETFWDLLGLLHQVDHHGAGLGDLGRPTGYVRRQIEGWCARWANAATPDASDFATTRQWLRQQMPERECAHAVIHGDYRLDNCVLALGDEISVRAVLDWEIGTVGDPLMDLGAALAYWTEPEDDLWFRQYTSQPSLEPGMLTRREIFERYIARTWLGVSWERFQFYLIYGYFRNAAITQQIYYRHFNGESSDERFAGLVERVNREDARCRVLISSLRS